MSAGWLSQRSGGAVLSVLTQARVWRSLGFEVSVHGVSDPGAPAMEATNADPDLVSHPGVGGETYIQSSSLVRRFESDLDDLDLVHLSGPLRGMNRKLAELCRRRGVPTILSSRGSFDPNASALARDASRSRATASDRGLLSWITAVHVTSTRERITSIWPVQDIHFINLPNVVDLTAYAPPSDAERVAARAQLGIPSDVRLLLHMGRLAPEKNLEFLVDMLRLVDARNVQLAFVGYAAPGVAESLSLLAQRQGVQNRVLFPGAAAGDQLRRWAVAADVHLVPSRGENFCLSLVEAVSLGAPVVCSPDVGALEFLPAGSARVTPLDARSWRDETVRALAHWPTSPAHQRHEELIQLFSIETAAGHWRTALSGLGFQKQTTCSQPTYKL